MSFPAVTVRADAAVEEAVEELFVKYRYSASPVLDGDMPVGLVDLQAVGRLPTSRRAAVTIGEVAVLDPS
jgi:predicted transcriptional regulator